MADPIAIISVSTSGAVGLGGLLSTVYQAVSQRRWQAREERVADLRDVLDELSALAGEATDICDTANDALRHAQNYPDEEEMALGEAKKRLARARERHARMWTVSKRIAIRTGPSSDVAGTARTLAHRILVWIRHMEAEPHQLGKPGLQDAMDAVQKAEHEFYEAAAAALAPPSGAPRTGFLSP